MVTLQTTLKTFYAAHNCMHMEFLMDDIGSGDVRKDFLCELRDESDVLYNEYPISRKPQSAILSFEIDLMSESKRIVSTKIPANTDTPVNDTDIIKAMKMKYGENVFDNSVTPCTSTPNLSTTSNLFYVLNSALTSENITKLTQIANAGNGLLTQRPPVWYLNPGQMDWLWHIGQGEVVLTYYDKSGAVLDIKTHTFGVGELYKVNIISLDPFVYSITGTHRIKIELNDAGSNLLETYNVYFKGCDTNVDWYVGLTYLEPMGGRASFNTGNVFKQELIRSSDDVYKPFNCEQTMFNTGGQSLMNTKAVRKRTFKTQIEYNGSNKYANLKAIENFFSSPGHHIQKGINENAGLQKCYLLDGSYQVYEKSNIIEVEYSVQLSEEVNNQREDK